MSLEPLPARAAWRHQGAREGFEVLHVAPTATSHRFRGETCAVEAGEAWAVGYDIEVDDEWCTVRATVTARTGDGPVTVLLQRHEGDRWSVDGQPRPELDGCVDVDLESSSATNTLPVHRLDLPRGVTVPAPAAFVRVDLRVQRLEQTYTRTGGTTFDYASATFDFSCELRYDASGLVLEYPGIATRVQVDPAQE